MRLHVIITGPNDATEVLTFTQDVVKIGASAGSDIVLDGPGVALRHAVLDVREAHVEVVDLSINDPLSNRTLRNGNPVEKTAPLDDGDTLTIGQFQLQVTFGPAKATPTPTTVFDIFTTPEQRKAVAKRLSQLEATVRDAMQRHRQAAIDFHSAMTDLKHETEFARQFGCAATIDPFLKLDGAPATCITDA